MARYFEDFSGGQGGWAGWGYVKNKKEVAKSGNPGTGPLAVPIVDGALHCSSPWWVDYNHAPPGQPKVPGVQVKGSYLHLLACLQCSPGPNSSTRPDIWEAGGKNKFVTGEFPKDWTGAKMTLRLRGQLDLRGARLGLLAQARVASVDRMVNSVLPFPSPITADWEEQSVTLVPEDDAWQCLGSRVDRFETYGASPISEVLSDMNGNIILVLFHLDVVPADMYAGRVPAGELHTRRAGLDYPVDYSRLPEGHVEFDFVAIEFPDDGSRL